MIVLIRQGDDSLCVELDLEGLGEIFGEREGETGNSFFSFTSCLSFVSVGDLYALFAVVFHTEDSVNLLDRERGSLGEVLLHLYSGLGVGLDEGGERLGFWTGKEPETGSEDYD